MVEGKKQTVIRCPHNEAHSTGILSKDGGVKTDKLWLLLHWDHPIGLFKSALAAMIWLNEHRHAFPDSVLPDNGDDDDDDGWTKWVYQDGHWPAEHRGGDGWVICALPINAGFRRGEIIADV